MAAGLRSEQLLFKVVHQAEPLGGCGVVYPGRGSRRTPILSCGFRPSDAHHDLERGYRPPLLCMCLSTSKGECPQCNHMSLVQHAVKGLWSGRWCVPFLALDIRQSDAHQGLQKVQQPRLLSATATTHVIEHLSNCSSISLTAAVLCTDVDDTR